MENQITKTHKCLEVCIDEDERGNITTRRLGAVFCDLDGVLVDSEPFKFFSYVQVLLRQGVPFDFLISRKNPDGSDRENFYDYYRKECVGESAEKNATRQLEWLKRNGIDLGMSWQEYRNARMEYYKPVEDSIPLIGKNIDLIKSLKQEYPETPVYIVSRTDEPRTRKILKRAGLENLVEIAVVPEKDRKKYSKAVALVLEREIRIEDCLAIEDSLKGAEEARDATNYKTEVVAVPTEFTVLQFRNATQKYLNADSVFRELSKTGRKFIYFNPQRPGHIQVRDSSWDYSDEEKDFIFYDYVPEKGIWEVMESANEFNYEAAPRDSNDSEIILGYEKERREYILSQVEKLRFS